MPQANDDPTLNSSNPSSVMVNAHGEYVVAIADQASWESYQKKTGGVASKPDEPKGSKELQDRGIECSMCHGMMRDAVKTPCCKNVYCEDCIQNALLETDLVCPACDAKDILLDSLPPDTETRNKVEEYKKEKDNGGAKKANDAPIAQDNQKVVPSVAPPAAPAAMRTNAPANRSPSVAKSSASTTPIPSTALMIKKRPAEDELGPEVPRGPAAMRNQQTMQQQHHQQFQIQTSYGPPSGQNMYNAHAFQQQYPNHGQQAYGGNAYGGFNNGGMGMGMNGMGSMGGGPGYAYNNSQGYGFQADPNGFQQQQQHLQQQQQQQFGFSHGGYNGYNQASFQQHQQQQFNKFPMGMVQGPNININANPNGGMGYGHFSNQQKTVFSEPFPSEEDSPYMRKPVNPHRHARPKRIRPSDFKAVGGEMM